MNIDAEAIFKGTKLMSKEMVPLITAAKKAVPESHHLTSPILFSLDELSKSLNEDAWFRVLGEVNLFFGNKSVPFLTGPYSVKDNDDFVDASFRWHAMNFVRGKFQTNKKTVATLSFNGILQSEIAYEKIIIDKSVTSLSTIAGISHAIVSSTFFRKGSLYPLYKYFEALISKPLKIVVKSPCGPKGMKKRYKGIPGVKWIEGTGDVQKCREVIKTKLFKLCSKANGCAYLEHKVKGEIYGMPNVVATMKQLGYKECTKDFTPKMLDTAIKRVCGKKQIPAKIDPSKIKTNQRFPTKMSASANITNKRIPAKTDASAKIPAKSDENSDSAPTSQTGIIDCVNGNFLYLMLTEGYNLAPDTKIHINFDNLPKDLDLDPSLGELLVTMQLF